MLYSSDIAETDLEEVIESGQYPSDDLEVSEYAESLALGVTEHLDEIDEQLASTSENWALDRMPVVDRSILRLATYEMMYVDGVPISVAINEAVELAKAYGGEDESARFVNGVLGRIARAIEPEAEAELTAEAAAEAPSQPESEAEATDER